jgi:hypothetical protein
MAFRVELGLLTTGVASGAAAAEIIPSSTVPISIVEIEIFLNAGTASTYGIGVPAAGGITPANNLMLKADPTLTYTVVTNIALSWGTGPTAPAAFIRRFASPATIGTGIIWTWPINELVIPAGKTLVIWNLAANGAVNLNVVGYEG